MAGCPSSPSHLGSAHPGGCGRLGPMVQQLAVAPARMAGSGEGEHGSSIPMVGSTLGHGGCCSRMRGSSEAAVGRSGGPAPRSAPAGFQLMATWCGAPRQRCRSRKTCAGAPVGGGHEVVCAGGGPASSARALRRTHDGVRGGRRQRVDGRWRRGKPQGCSTDARQLGGAGWICGAAALARWSWELRQPGGGVPLRAVAVASRRGCGAHAWRGAASGGLSALLVLEVGKHRRKGHVGSVGKTMERPQAPFTLLEALSRCLPAPAS